MPSGCVRWQCAELFGQEECLHYVKRPEDVKVELLSDNSSETDSVVVSWKPNFYGETPEPPLSPPHKHISPVQFQIYELSVKDGLAISRLGLIDDILSYDAKT